MSNPNKYWFKRRRYGWGYMPVTWQGWTVVVLFLAGVYFATRMLPSETEDPTSGQLVRFVLTLAVLIFALILIGLAKGPKPRWRWGKKPTDNPEEDF